MSAAAGRAALHERVGAGLEVAHVPLDAGDAAHPVAMVVAVAQDPVPNRERRLGAFDRGLGFKTKRRGGEPPAPPPILHLRCGVGAFRLSLSRGAGALP